MKNRLERKRTRTIYTKGEINRLIDSLCHPLSKTSPAMLIIDGFLHGLVERNPPLSVRKFLKHNVPMLIEEAGREYGKEGYKAAKELRKAVQSSLKLAEKLKKIEARQPCSREIQVRNYQRMLGENFTHEIFNAMGPKKDGIVMQSLLENIRNQ